MRRTILTTAALVAWGVSACSSPAPRTTADSGRPEAEMLSQRGRVMISTRDGRELKLDVEIASNHRDRQRGLMFRREMPEMAGMIFVFAQQEQQSFWMKNTYLPLDMMFIDEGGKVIGIVENAEPQTTTARGVPGESKYVLEVNGGWSARHGVGAGDTVRLEGMYQLE